MKQIFRKSQLDKLSSPEQLDKMIVVTPPSFWIALAGTAIILVAALVWAMCGSIPASMSMQGIYVSEEGVLPVFAETAGEVKKVMAGKGDQVQKGDVIAKLDTGEIRTASDGTVCGLEITEGSRVEQGEEIARLLPDDDSEKVIVCYVPFHSGKKIQEGMQVLVYPTTVNTQDCGHMEAEVIHVDPYVTSVQDMKRRLGDDSLVETFQQDGPVVEVICSLRTAQDTASGYYWTGKKGDQVRLDEGTMVEADVIMEEKAPISLLFPYIREQFG